MYNKTGYITLETTANRQYSLNSNIEFFTTDNGHAELVISMTQNKTPLEISTKNSDTFIVLEKDNGEYIVDYVRYIDPLNGKIAYTLPTRFLSKKGEVKGQVYVQVKGTEDVITTVFFTLSIKEALVDSIPTVDKVQEIRTFKEWRENIQGSVDDLKKVLGDSSSIVEGVKKLIDNGKTQVDNMTNDNIMQLDNAKTSAINDIKALNTADTSKWQKSKITQDDGKVAQIANFDFEAPEKTLGDTTQFVYINSGTNSPANTSGVVRYTVINVDYKRLEFFPNTENNVYIRKKEGGKWSTWKKATNDYDLSKFQKYRLSNDDGTTLYDSSLVIDFNNDDQLKELGVGTRHVANTVNAPLGASSVTGWLTKYSRDNGVVQYLEFRPYNSNQIFIKRFYNTWSQWEQIGLNANKRKVLGTLSSKVTELPPGNYEANIPMDYKSVNAPPNATKTAYLAFIDVFEGSMGNKQINVIQVAENNTYRGTIQNNLFKGWQLIQSNAEGTKTFQDTDWIDLKLENGTMANDTFTSLGAPYTSQYRVITQNGVTRGYLRINIKNITPNVIIGKIPTKMIPKPQTGLLRSTPDKKSVIYNIDVNGNIYIVVDDVTKWTNTDYVIGEINWLIDNTYFDNSNSNIYIEGESPEDLGIKVRDEESETLENDTDDDTTFYDDFTENSMDDVLPDYGDILDEPEEDS